MMKSDHKTVVSFVRTKKKFWVLSKDKCKMINCKYAKMGNTFPARFKEEGYYDL